jgi:hypothetical protein
MVCGHFALCCVFLNVKKIKQTATTPSVLPILFMFKKTYIIIANYRVLSKITMLCVDVHCLTPNILGWRVINPTVSARLVGGAKPKFDPLHRHAKSHLTLVLSFLDMYTDKCLRYTGSQEDNGGYKT